MSSLKAFHSDPVLKAFVLNQLALHREADKLVKGTYWEHGKGCAVGCTLEAVCQFRKAAKIDHGKHALYETYLGIPQIIARLEDRIFENLDNGKSQAWPERFTNAIRPGADLSGVWPRFAIWLLVDPDAGVIQFAKNNRQRKAIQGVADAYARGETDKEVWSGLKDAHAAAAAYDAAAHDAAAHAAAAAYAAYDAAAHAAAAYDAAAHDAAAYAAAAAYDAAAHAAAAAAAHAAYAAAAAYDAAAHAAYAAAAAYSKHYERVADKLIELLEAAP